MVDRHASRAGRVRRDDRVRRSRRILALVRAYRATRDASRGPAAYRALIVRRPCLAGAIGAGSAILSHGPARSFRADSGLVPQERRPHGRHGTLGR